jgi:hypothetical protein
MVRKILIAILIIAVGTGVWFSYRYFVALQNENSNPITAVPNDAVMVIQVNNAHQVWEKLSFTNLMWEELKSTDYIFKTDVVGTYLDTLIMGDKQMRKVIVNNPIAISAHMNGDNDFEFLFCINVPKDIEEDAVLKFVKNKLKRYVTLKDQKYKGSTITSIGVKGEDQQLFYTQKNRIFIVSQSKTLVQASIKQLESGKSITKNPSFIEVSNTSGKKTDANVYINYKRFPTLASTYLSGDLKENMDMLEPFANWAELDLSIQPNALQFNGFTLSKDSTHFLHLIRKHRPQRVEVTSIVPSNVASLISLGIEDFSVYFNDYKNLLDRTNKLDAYTETVDSINIKYNCDIEYLMLSWIGNELAVFSTEPTSARDLTSYKYAALKYGESTDPEGSLNELDRQLKEAGTEPAAALTFQKYIIRQIPTGALLQNLLGDMFDDIQSPYYTIIGGYVVFANGQNAIKNLIRDYNNDNTLSKSLTFDKYSRDHLSRESNIFMYSNIARSPYLYEHFLADKHNQDISENIDLFRKFEAVSWQISTSKKNLFYNSIFFKYNPIYKKESGSLWEVKLDTTVSSKPIFFRNHKTNAKDVFVQDDNNTIYLIGATGKILWKKEMSERIESKIWQVDVYKNKKNQLLFSTATAIHLLDRNGNPVKGFPVKLKARASGPLAVIDYDKKRNYRLLIACEDNKVYNYDSKGKIITGWKFGKSKSKVQVALEHRLVNGKDYLFFHDSTGNIYLLNRKGETRFEAKKSITGKSANPVFFEAGATIGKSKVVYSDTAGRIVKLFFNGAIDTFQLQPMSKNHFFTYGDLNNDKLNDFTLLESNSMNIYGADKTLLFNHQLDSTATHPPQIFHFPQHTPKIGIVSGHTENVYLFNTTSGLEADMPVNGSTQFSIADMNRDGLLNLVVSSGGQYIYIYTLK